MSEQNTDDGWWRFLTLCTQLKTEQEFEQLFDLFLTIDERSDVANRYLIIQQLLAGDITQREISQTLGVSISKITRGSNMLKVTAKEFRDFLTERMT